MSTSKTTVGLDRASQRAQERAQAKASRAAAAGLKLPTRKKKSEILVLRISSNFKRMCKMKINGENFW